MSLFGGSVWLWEEPFGVKHCLTMVKRCPFLEEVCGSEKSLLVCFCSALSGSTGPQWETLVPSCRWGTLLWWRSCHSAPSWTSDGRKCRAGDRRTPGTYRRPSGRRLASSWAGRRPGGAGSSRRAPTATGAPRNTAPEPPSDLWHGWSESGPAARVLTSWTNKECKAYFPWCTCGSPVRSKVTQGWLKALTCTVKVTLFQGLEIPMFLIRLRWNWSSQLYYQSQVYTRLRIVEVYQYPEE